MTARLTCTDCQLSIPNGEAWLRSIALEQVAFCFSCWAGRSVGMAEVRFEHGAGVVIREARARQAAAGVAAIERHANSIRA